MSEKALVLDAEIITIYRDSFEMFVLAHITVAEFGGQLVFDVSPGGGVVQANARRNLGKARVGDWQQIQTKIARGRERVP